MLDTFQKKYANKNKQFVLVQKTGVVIESDQALFPVDTESSIFELHPFFESFTAVLEGNEEENFFGIHITFKEKIFIVDITAIPEKEGLLLIFKDLTEHYNTYQTITQRRNESVIKTELTVLKNLELQERERFKNSFIQNFSHELRNPLTSIMAIIDILNDTSLTDEQIHMLNFLKESTTNLRLMLEDTLSIGMIDAGKLQIQHRVFDLHNFFELLQFTYTTKAKKKGLKFQGFWDEKIPKLVEGDRLRLFQILTNLLDNASKYTKKGSIELDVKLNQKRANIVNLRFQVTDSGIGISEKNRDAIFESFSQVDSKEVVHNKGVGLGLTIAKKLLELMGSTIKMESTLGEGSKFYFDLSVKYPLFESDENANSKIGKKSKFVSNTSDQAKFKILLVEDDTYVQTTLFKMLLNTHRFKIDLAYDGALVLQSVVNNNYDLILMDVNLPNLTGIQITKLIRQFPFNNIKNIPIIGLTANAYQENLTQCLKAGMQKVLTKPFEKEELITTIFKILKITS